MKRTIQYLICLVVLGSSIFTFSNCKDPATGGKPVLAVTIAPQQYLLERIVGDKFDVVTLLSAAADPETYDPAVSSLLTLQKSKIFFRVGTLGFEQAALGKIAQSSPDLKIVNCSSGIPLAEGTHGGPNGYDPHVWTSVKNARTMAKNMYQAVIKESPADKEYFTRRYQLLDQELASLDSTINVILKPHTGEYFVIRHPSLTYFANDYHLNQLSLEINGKEPTPAEMKRRIDQVRASKANIFFIEKGHNNDASVNIASSLNIPVTEVSLLDYDWKDNLLNVARAIAGSTTDSTKERQ